MTVLIALSPVRWLVALYRTVMWLTRTSSRPRCLDRSSFPWLPGKLMTSPSFAFIEASLQHRRLVKIMGSPGPATTPHANKPLNSDDRLLENVVWWQGRGLCCLPCLVNTSLNIEAFYASPTLFLSRIWFWSNRFLALSQTVDAVVCVGCLIKVQK